MESAPLRQTRLSRRLALLASLLVLRPRAVAAEHDGT
jgi:hypothetical protein